ncbi:MULTISPECIES: DUF3159 domain-containing protein [unclassified Pseudoclavibacter]|uniref:DUF3159 domain-containing protein n=1 Tax=unclassified Pseudoclavibacter TaxID=2615177 RepID=UPI002015EE18|nr:MULTISPECIES: DUF3159 domain-containing protein [unclassified Pseudoclavibacter]
MTIPDGERQDAPQPASDAPNMRKLEEAAKSSSLGRLTEGGISGASLLAAMGGIRGLIETLLPGIVFLVLFTLGTELWVAVIAPAALGLLFILIRALQKEPVVPAISGLVALLISGVLAMTTGRGENFYLVGFYTNAAYGAALLVSVLVRWPVIGLVTGLITGQGSSWRQDRSMLRWMSIITLVWVGFFALRLAVQLPLYFAGNVEALGLARLLMGTPMYAVVLVVTVLFVRALLSASRSRAQSEAGKVS